MTTLIEDAELIINWMVTPNVEDAWHNMPAPVFYACYRVAKAYKKEHEVKDDPQDMIHADWCEAMDRKSYFEQTVNVGQGGGTVQMKFSAVTLKLEYRQAEALARELMASAQAGRRAFPPTIQKGDRVRCLVGMSRGQIGEVLSVKDDGRISIAFAKNAVGGGYQPYQLELTPDE